MSVWAPAAGQTLLIPSGPAGYHLHLVLNDPIPLPGYPGHSCVLVCLCSIHPHTPANAIDTTCILHTGAHPFIQHESYIAYKYTRIDNAADLIARVAQNVFQVHQPCNDPPFSQIKAGLNASPRTRNAFKNLPI
jgi:hypothetical protein